MIDVQLGQATHTEMVGGGVMRTPRRKYPQFYVFPGWTSVAAACPATKTAGENNYGISQRLASRTLIPKLCKYRTIAIWL